MAWWTVIKETLFGSGKGIIEQTSDVIDKWNPSQGTLHKQSVEDMKAGDDSQKSAREMVLPTHDDLFNRIIDGASRAVRPIVTYWIIGGLVGLYQLKSPSTDPLMMNIVWTVLTFWFGSRMIFKDLPNLIRSFRK